MAITRSSLAMAPTLVTRIPGARYSSSSRTSWLRTKTPDVTLVPNGIADKAGNEQDDGEAEAKDYIAPSFTVVSVVCPEDA